MVNLLSASYIRIDKPFGSGYYTPKETLENDEKNTQNAEKLTAEQKIQIARLQAMDSAVKAHERAHISAGAGVILSGANFVYQKAPDEKLYAIGGEVTIDTSKESTPQETIAKMQIVRTAALAPADPSSTDYQVASTATMISMQSRLEIMREMQMELIKNAREKYSNANNEDTSYSFSNYA
ncbi:MAG: putative metalloprotease CJM1_0395 family protein [Sulfurospirillaceae bacterium]|nr:putative metalloprotease CJM1_0395 family protein [Sulfurospirillaceae bacterium]